MKTLLMSILIIFVPIIAMTLFLLGFYLENLQVSLFGTVIMLVMIALRKHSDYYRLR
jgi:hypothetical protein